MSSIMKTTIYMLKRLCELPVPWLTCDRLIGFLGFSINCVVGGLCNNGVMTKWHR